MTMGVKSQLKRWQKAGLIDQHVAGKILAFEIARSSGRFGTAMLALGALAIALGLAAITASNWDAIPTALKFAGVIAINLALAGGVFHALQKNLNAAREVLLFLLAAAVLSFIALIGQVYQTGAPTWQALTLWLVLVSPFLFMFARARFTVVVWVAMVWWTLGSAFEAVHAHLGALYLDIAFYTLIPLVMIGVGEAPRIRDRWPSWTYVLATAGYFLVMLMTSIAQVAWLNDNRSMWHLTDNAPQYHIPGTALVAAALTGALLAALWFLDCLGKQAKKILPFLAASIFFGFLPLVAYHVELAVVGAALFMAYWALIGWTGLQLGNRGILNASIVIIAIRLIVVYIEVFGSLLSTGIGLITSGALLIALVVGTRKLMRKLGHAI